MPTPTQPVRGTQSFVGTLASVWSRPLLVGTEVTWRWLFGAPALALLLTRVRQVLLTATGGTLDPAALGLPKTLVSDPVGSLASDPLNTANQIASALSRVAPQLTALAGWLLPVLFLAWVVFSGLGRTAMLRRADAALTAKPLQLMAWHATRVLAIGCMFWLWSRALAAGVSAAVLTPMGAGADPNFVLLCAIAIVATLGLFVLWGFLGWLFSVAPLLAMSRNLSFGSSFAAALRLGPLRPRLVEINLVMGIVKIALIVLAMVFTATPLPFESVTSPAFLFWWWVGVMLLYFVASDFFHVARLIGYLELYRRYEREGVLQSGRAEA